MAGTLKEIGVTITGDVEVNYDIVHDFSKALAKSLNPDTSLITWCDKKTNNCGPAEVCKTIDSDHVDAVELERYGLSHGGAVKIDVNNGDYVFIYN
jgi:hypothetical protein